MMWITELITAYYKFSYSCLKCEAVESLSFVI